MPMSEIEMSPTLHAHYTCYHMPKALNQNDYSLYGLIWGYSREIKCDQVLPQHMGN